MRLKSFFLRWKWLNKRNIKINRTKARISFPVIDYFFSISYQRQIKRQRRIIFTSSFFIHHFIVMFLKCGRNKFVQNLMFRKWIKNLCLIRVVAIWKKDLFAIFSQNNKCKLFFHTLKLSVWQIINTGIQLDLIVLQT